jgi:hypothetical protein
MTSKLKGTKSLRPKEFTRDTYASSLTKGDSERFAENALPTLWTANANLILEHCRLNKYERNKYLRDTEILHLEEADREYEQRHRQEFINSRVNHMHTVLATEKKKMDDMTEKWKKTQFVKTQRRTRDLQYELSQLEISDLKSLRQRQIHTKDEIVGIEQFERNMKRMGISTGEGADQRISVSYEAKDAYEQRIKDLSKETFPPDEEVNKFKSQLKERTTTKRLARYEKARRRRRALVDQAETLANSLPESGNV